jgi:hypothetical protein
MQGWGKCPCGCKEIISPDAYEVDVRNNRVTSVKHTTKRCMELVRMHKGLKPLPVGQTTLL